MQNSNFSKNHHVFNIYVPDGCIIKFFCDIMIDKPKIKKLFFKNISIKIQSWKNVYSCLNLSPEAKFEVFPQNLIARDKNFLFWFLRHKENFSLFSEVILTPLAKAVPLSLWPLQKLALSYTTIMISSNVQNIEFA